MTGRGAVRELLVAAEASGFLQDGDLVLDLTPSDHFSPRKCANAGTKT